MSVVGIIVSDKTLNQVVHQPCPLSSIPHKANDVIVLHHGGEANHMQVTHDDYTVEFASILQYPC